MGCGCNSNFEGGSKRAAFSMAGAKKRVAEHRAKFSSFMGKKASKHSNFSNSNNVNLSDEHLLGYNTNNREDFGNFTDKGFLNQGELEEFDY
tara:strand:+ start:3150 stop:3425 length:276 start_codon:yes stop_codon:yes gene_type:complete